MPTEMTSRPKPANWKAHAEHSEPYAREKAYSETHREQTAGDGFVASANSKVFSPAGLQVGREDRGQESGPLRQSGRGDQSREDPLCRVFAVTGWGRRPGSWD